MNDPLQATEDRAAEGATHPRVSLGDINAAIMDEYYCTGAQAAAGNPDPAFPHDHPLQRLTICLLVLRNGYTVVGRSAAASPENFDPGFGKTLAREDAMRQLWPLMGFALRDRLHARNEATGKDVAAIAGRRLHDSDPEVRALAGSALTQAPDRP